MALPPRPGDISLSVESRPCPDVQAAVEIIVKGQMSSTTIATLRGCIETALAGRACILLLGLKDVAFLPSITLSYLADLIRRLDRRGGAIGLVSPSQQVKIVVTALGLDTFFTSFVDFDAARAYAKERSARNDQQHRLVMVRGPIVGQVFLVDETPLIIGSTADAGIPLRLPRVALKHAEVRVVEGTCVVNDLGTTLGTQVGGMKASNTPLANRATIRIGPDVELMYLGPGEPIER